MQSLGLGCLGLLATPGKSSLRDPTSFLALVWLPFPGGWALTPAPAHHSSQSLCPSVGPSQRPLLLRRHSFSAPHAEVSGLWDQLEPPWELRVMPSASEARPGEAGPCQGKRGRHRHRLGHPFWETPVLVGGGGAMDRAAAATQATGHCRWLPAARGHSQAVPPLRSSARPPGRVTRTESWEPVPRRPHVAASRRLCRVSRVRPQPRPAPTRCLRSAAHATRQAASFSTLFRGPSFPPAPG